MRRTSLAFFVLSTALAGALLATAQDAIPLKEYAQRRTRLLAQLDAPVVLFGYGAAAFGISGPERIHPETTFRQEENFYYLSGHREPDAALLLIPATNDGAGANARAREILFLLPRDKGREHWEGVRVGPSDPGIAERTGFAEVKPLAALRGELERALDLFPNLYTLFPLRGTEGEPSHAGYWLAWLRSVAPTANLRDVGGTLGAMRQVKSPGEQALLHRAIERSMDAHRAAMQTMRPGLFEYEIAARMEYSFQQAGCERHGYAPIVGSGFNSTVLHYTANRREMKAGEVVVIDVGAECAGYTADITRTLPTSGKFSRRQREIYEIVLAAQNAAIAAVKPGMTLGRAGENSLYRIAYDYINTHGKDVQGGSLGQYFIHGLGHHIGLQVHDAGEPARALQPGMIVTIEPGIYIPEESLGVRIEDIVLVTENGAELLTASLPRTVEEIEQAMSVQPRSGWAAWGGLCLTRLPPPVYPPLARLAGIQGKLRIHFEVDERGRVAASAEGHPILQQWNVQETKRWEFGCLANAESFPVEFSLELEYKLEGDRSVGQAPSYVEFDLPQRIVIVSQPGRLH